MFQKALAQHSWRALRATCGVFSEALKAHKRLWAVSKSWRFREVQEDISMNPTGEKKKSTKAVWQRPYLVAWKCGWAGRVWELLKHLEI